jgi:hypothetical protein
MGDRLPVTCSRKLILLCGDKMLLQGPVRSGRPHCSPARLTSFMAGSSALVPGHWEDLPWEKRVPLRQEHLSCAGGPGAPSTHGVSALGSGLSPGRLFRGWVDARRTSLENPGYCQNLHFSCLQETPLGRPAVRYFRISAMSAWDHSRFSGSLARLTACLAFC